MLFVVYKLYCVSNGKDYIGITENMKRRFNIHWNCFTDTVLSRTIKKYGKENFIISILEKVNSWREACNKEQFYIKKLKTKVPDGMNMTDGGEGVYGLNHSEKTRKQMSQSHIGKGIGKDNPMYGKPGAMLGKKWSIESRKRLSESCKGRTPWNKNKKCSQLSGKNNGFFNKKHSAKTKKRLSEKAMGKKWSDELRDKILKARIGCQEGEKHSQAKLKEKDILKIRTEYKIKKYNQYELACVYNITQSMISNIIRRKSWTHI